MSAHSASSRGGWLSALVAHVSDYVFEPIEETVEPKAEPLQPRPVIAIVSAAPKSGATTVARMLAAELASRGDGVAIVASPGITRRGAPPSRASVRLATALRGVADVQPCGRLCTAHLRRPPADAAAQRSTAGAASPHAADARVASADWAVEAGRIANAARYLAPVVLDVPADGSAVAFATIADRSAVVAQAAAEPPLLDAVAALIGGHSLKVVNRLVDGTAWAGRADIRLPDSRIAARSAALGTRPLGPLGAAIAELADALEGPR